MELQAFDLYSLLYFRIVSMTISVSPTNEHFVREHELSFLVWNEFSEKYCLKIIFLGRPLLPEMNFLRILSIIASSITMDYFILLSNIDCNMFLDNITGYFH